MFWSMFPNLGRILLFFAFPLLSLCAETSGLPDVITERKILQVGGDPRAYTISYPKDLENRARCPLIIAFHGYRGDVKTWFYEELSFPALMAKDPFVIVYPEGPIGWSQDSNSADVTFFDAILAAVKDKFPIDPSRIYVGVISTGGLPS